MAACPYDHYAHNIEHRYDQCREGDHDGTGGIVCNIRIVRCIADGEEYQNIALLSFATLGVLVPFFYYNVFGQADHGRKIFMGDTGSLTLGYILVFR